MELQSVKTYLTELQANNNRDWYHAHKEDYTRANAAFEAFIGAVMAGISAFDPDAASHPPKELTFKLVRDTRFSHDKSPYQPAFRAHIGPKGKLPIPVGYYMMLKPGNQSFLGGGLFADMFKDATAMVRQAIADKPEKWAGILAAPDFAEHFTVRGAALKKVPAGFDPEHPQAAYLKHKSWYLEVPIPDEALDDADQLTATAVEAFRWMKPFNDFLNGALEGFRMPER